MKLQNLSVIKLWKNIRKGKKEVCKHIDFVTPSTALKHLEREGQALSRGEGKMMVDGLNNIYKNCVLNKECYCFNCHKYFKKDIQTK